MHTLSHLSNSIRDANVVTTIQTAFETHNRVLVIYGASHLVFEWDQLIALYGKPKKIKVF